MNTPPEPNREKELFSAALDLTAAEREAFLDRECAGDDLLRQRIEDLLRVHGGADEVFPTQPGELTEIAQISEGPGSRIGKYKLLEQIGEGGMGVVYLAEQEGELLRRVALKIIKLGMDTKAVVARFEAERQALAMMNHPNIAKVLDAGATETGRPFFVMELVKGMPITEYCDKRKLNTQQRLELFIPVCQAIQHAHQKGIIHRDIKPSNVLVAHFDGKPMPMVIDFGIAKATHQRLTEQTVFTRHGQVIGTLEYIAPEQAEGSQLDIDTRADVYSLGVLLYQLLTGSTPFPGKRLREAGWEKMMKIIQEEDPQRPSTRFSTMTEDERSKLGTTHGERPGRISLLLRRELDWIVMRCLAKDRSERYETANGLAMDIGRYLRGDAPEAAPPTWSYQFSKLARKHKKTFAMAAVIVGILAVATTFSAYQAVVATTARIKAQKAEQETQEQAKETLKQKLATDTMNAWVKADLLGLVNPWSAEPGRERTADLTLKDAILISGKDVSTRFEDQPEIAADIHFTMGSALKSLGVRTEALEHLQAAYDLFSRALGPTHTNTLAAQFELGWYINDNRWFREGTPMEEGQKLMERAYSVAVSNLGEEDPLTVHFGALLGVHYLRVENYEAADMVLSRVAKLVGRMTSPDARYPHRLGARVNLSLAQLRRIQGRRAEARVLCREVQAANRAAHSNSVFSIGDVEAVLATTGDLTGWDGQRQMAQEILLEWLDRSRPLVIDAYPVPEILTQLMGLNLDRHDFESAFRFSQERFKSTLATQGLITHVGRGAASIPAALGDWDGAFSELRRQRLEMGSTDGPRMALELMLAELRHDTNSFNELAAAFVQILRINTNFVADGSASKALLSASFSIQNVELAELAVQATFTAQSKTSWWKSSRSGEALAGMLAYRRGDYPAVIRQFEPVITELGPVRITLIPMYVLAMAYQQQENTPAATKLMADAERVIVELLRPGLTTWNLYWPEQWEPIAEALLLRREAETLLYGKPIASAQIAETLAKNRRSWNEVARLLNDAAMAARRREYAKAQQFYLQATNHPAFNFRAAQEFNSIGEGLFAVQRALGDETGQVETLRQLQEDFMEGRPMEYFYLQALAWSVLPPDLVSRIDRSPNLQRIEEKWRNTPEQLRESEILTIGMLRYREGKDVEALTLLSSPMKVNGLVPTIAGRAFAAMAHWNLKTAEDQDEARRLLKEADERFNQTVIEPGEGMYPPDFAGCVMMEMIINEADRWIDPGVDNAPHVAALPPEGWGR